MELRDLRAFVTAADLGQITLAAAHLHVVQSAVSQAVKRLERELDLILLERRPDGVRPTDAGRALSRHGHSIVNAVARAEEEMAAIRGLSAGAIRVGLLHTTMPLLLVPLLRRLRAAHPGLELQIEEGMAAELIDRLRLGHIDVAVVFLPVDSTGVEIVELASVPLAVAHWPGHRLAGRRRVDLADLATEDWISFSDGNPGRRWLDDAGALAGFHPRVTTETDTLAHLKAFVESGAGIAMLPAAATEPERQIGRLQLTRVIAPRPAVTIAYAVGADPPSDALAAVRPLIEESVLEAAADAGPPA